MHVGVVFIRGISIVMLILLRSAQWYQQLIAFGGCCGSLSLQLWSPCVVPSMTKKYGILLLRMPVTFEYVYTLLRTFYSTGRKRRQIMEMLK